MSLRVGGVPECSWVFLVRMLPGGGEVAPHKELNIAQKRQEQPGYVIRKPLPGYCHYRGILGQYEFGGRLRDCQCCCRCYLRTVHRVTTPRIWQSSE